jgi:hypothetical protein
MDGSSLLDDFEIRENFVDDFFNVIDFAVFI